LYGHNGIELCRQVHSKIVLLFTNFVASIALE
jgi:hypothetical protein